MFRSVRCDDVEVTEPLVSPERMLTVLENVVSQNHLIVAFLCNCPVMKSTTPSPRSDKVSDEERIPDSAA